MAGEVRHDVLVRCSPEHAFDVFTRDIDQWWPPGHRRLAGEAHTSGSSASMMTFDARPGGRIEESGGGRTLVVGEVLVWDPPRTLVLGWALGAPADAWTRVTVTFTAEGPSTRVLVVHTEGPRPHPDWSGTVARFVRGWSAVLSALADRIHDVHDASRG